MNPHMLAPRSMPKGRSRSWLDEVLDTHPISAAAEEQREHDIKAVAAMREKLAKRKATGKLVALDEMARRR